MSVTVGNEHHQAWTNVWKLCPAIFLHFAAQNFCACKDQKRYSIFLIFTRNLEQKKIVAAEIFLSRWVGVCKSKPIRSENPISSENMQQILEDKMRPNELGIHEAHSLLLLLQLEIFNTQCCLISQKMTFLGGRERGTCEPTLVSLPERLWTNVHSFHLVPRFEERSLGMTVNCEFNFWRRHFISLKHRVQ